jgi:hypothetical protein
MTAPPAGPLWDVFCRVIDNRGDAGVAWRLSRNLAQRGQRVRLWIDRPDALAGMADADDLGLAIRVRPWDEANGHDFDADAEGLGDRLVELFGCEPAPAAVRARGRRAAPPPWINVEYLSAEPYVERSHALRSPIHAGDGRGQDRWFYFPGFGPGTGGLLREPGLTAARDAHDPDAWWPAPAGSRPRRAGSLFQYRLSGPLAHALAGWPEDAAATLGGGWGWIEPGASPQDVTGSRHAWPWLTQSAYDRLLWSCELNVVRGEDSFVRAQWAARPFLWQAYPQADGAHEAKLEAFLDRYLADAHSPVLAGDLRLAFRALNGFAPVEALGPALGRALQPAVGWAAHARRWADALARQDDLASQLIAFAAAREGQAPRDG